MLRPVYCAGYSSFEFAFQPLTNQDVVIWERMQENSALFSDKLRLKPGETFLDIGCGWGALICHAARNYGVRAHGATLSQATVSLCDYRTPQGRYDSPLPATREDIYRSSAQNNS